MGKIVSISGETIADDDDCEAMEPIRINPDFHDMKDLAIELSDPKLFNRMKLSEQDFVIEALRATLNTHTPSLVCYVNCQLERLKREYPPRDYQTVTAMFKKYVAALKNRINKDW